MPLLIEYYVVLLLYNIPKKFFNKKMPCKDIKFSSKIKPFKIFEQSEMHWKN